MCHRSHPRSLFARVRGVPCLSALCFSISFLRRRSRMDLGSSSSSISATSRFAPIIVQKSYLEPVSFLLYPSILAEQKRYLPEKPWIFQGFFIFQGPKAQGFSVDTKPPFFPSCRTRTCVNPILGAIRASDQKYFRRFRRNLSPLKQQNIESSRQVSR